MIGSIQFFNIVRYRTFHKFIHLILQRIIIDKSR
nr:MAG TPA: hypothetical protein [Caudoviricetes sp.]